MSRITAKLHAKRGEPVIQVSGEIRPEGVARGFAKETMVQFVKDYMNFVVEFGGTGLIEFLYEPGIGISIDIRKYNVSQLPPSRQKRFLKRIKSIEDASVQITNDRTLSIRIKVALEIIE